MPCMIEVGVIGGQIQVKCDWRHPCPPVNHFTLDTVDGVDAVDAWTRSSPVADFQTLVVKVILTLY